MAAEGLWAFDVRQCYCLGGDGALVVCAFLRVRRRWDNKVDDSIVDPF